MHRPLNIALIATVCLAGIALYPHRDLISLALAKDDGVRPDSPILRSETQNRSSNRRRHMNRLYNKMDEDFYSNTVGPLLLDQTTAPDSLPDTALALGTGDDTTLQAFGGRAALTSLTRNLDFDSAVGTFPSQTRNSAAPISIWVVGNQVGLENRIASSGYDPGISGDTVSIDSGVDYLLSDWLAVGLGVGWGSTLGESSSRQLSYDESNLSVSPYFVARLTDWLNLRGSIEFGESTIDQTAIGPLPDDLSYAESLESSTIASSLGLGSKYEFGSLPLTVEFGGDLVSAREKFDAARATDGGTIPARVAHTRLFDANAEARYAITVGNHRLVPFVGQSETIALMNQDFGRSTTTRYEAGSRYYYDPYDLGISVQGFRELSTDSNVLEGIRSEISFTGQLPHGYGFVSPQISTESTNTYLQMGGGITHNWGKLPGQVSFKVRRKFTYEVQHSDLSGLLSVHFDF